MTTTSDDTYTYVIAIAASRDQVWRGLTDPEFTKCYWHNTRIRSSFKVGDVVEFLSPNQTVVCRGEVLISDAPRTLSYTWLFPENPETCDEKPSRVTFRLKAIGNGTRLEVVHDRFEPDSKTKVMISGGWPLVLAGLKTLLETGRAIDFSISKEH